MEGIFYSQVLTSSSRVWDMFVMTFFLTSCIVAHVFIGWFSVPCDSKPASVSILVLGLSEGLTSIKRMPWNTFGRCRAEMTPQSGLGILCCVVDSASLLFAPYLSF